MKITCINGIHSRAIQHLQRILNEREAEEGL